MYHVLCWFNNNAPNLEICVFTLGLLSICIEYGLETWLTNRDKIIVLELDMQHIGNKNSLRTWVRPTEDVRILSLEVQPNCSVYELE